MHPQLNLMRNFHKKKKKQTMQWLKSPVSQKYNGWPNLLLLCPSAALAKMVQLEYRELSTQKTSAALSGIASALPAPLPTYTKNAINNNGGNFRVCQPSGHVVIVVVENKIPKWFLPNNRMQLLRE